MRRLLLAVCVLTFAAPAATITLATVAPAVASAHEKGDGPDNGPYRGRDCGGEYISPFGDHTPWFDCWLKEELREYVPDGGFTHYQVWGMYAHWRDGWILSHVSWRYRYTFV